MALLLVALPQRRVVSPLGRSAATCPLATMTRLSLVLVMTYRFITMATIALLRTQGQAVYTSEQVRILESNHILTTRI